MQTIPVSVITPVYNAERFLRQTVDSVSAQTCPPVEHLLIDDGSTDGSLALAKCLEREHPLVRVIAVEKNAGVMATLNIGIQESRCPYVAILDSDDIALPHWLEKVFPVLEADSSVGTVGGGCIFMTEKGLVTGRTRWCKQKGDVTELVLAGEYGIHHPGSVHRRVVLLQTGGYNPRFGSSGDADMFLNMAAVSRLVNVGEPLIYYRRLRASLSRKTSEYGELSKKYLRSKAALLSSGKSIAEANSELEPIVEQMAEVPRLTNLTRGSYEHEMAKSFRKGGCHFYAARYYLAAALAGYRPFSCCLWALRCLIFRFPARS